MRGSMIREGEIYPTNNSGFIWVIEYINANKIKVMFEDTGSYRFTRAHLIREGRVKDVTRSNTCEVGKLGNYRRTPQSKRIHSVWSSMLERCYDKGSKAYRFYGGRGVKVCDEWLTFACYQEWYLDNYREGYEIDKDIFSEGEKVYSPATCRFVPKDLNIVLCSFKKSKRGLLPGVSIAGSGRYIVRVTTEKGRKYLGLYDDLEEAHKVYLLHKKDYLTRLANRMLLEGKIDEDVHDKVIKWSKKL